MQYACTISRKLQFVDTAKNNQQLLLAENKCH